MTPRRRIVTDGQCFRIQQEYNKLRWIGGLIFGQEEAWFFISHSGSHLGVYASKQEAQDALNLIDERGKKGPWWPIETTQ